jgi:hypothetical protein
MLTEDKLIEKLHRTAEQFKEAVREKKYFRAKALYNDALAVAVYVELDIEKRGELFGQYSGIPDDQEAPQGLFPRKDVSRVDLECCIKRNKAYEDRTCGIMGKPTQYYSDEDFCARCMNMKKNRMR